MEEKEGTVENPSLFPYGISRSRCRNYQVADRRLLSKRFRIRAIKYVSSNSLTLSIYNTRRKKTWEQRSAHFCVRWPSSPPDHRQVIEVFLKSFRQVSQASLLLG